MIPVLLSTGIEPVTATRSVNNGRPNASRALAQLEPGDLVHARVVSRFPDGSFKVVLAGETLRMSLPAHVNPGETLELTFVTREPRLTFALQEPAREPTAPALSSTGRLVAALMPQAGQPATIATAPGTTPLFVVLPANGSALSVSLQNVLEQSGLFYEAHQADWVAGKHDLAQLRDEPQALLARNTAPREVQPAHGTATTLHLAPDSSGPAGVRHPEQMSSAPPLVQQQLAALESGRVVLQIEVWPKQWMQWEIEEHHQNAAGEQQTPDKTSDWHTRLHLDLPRFGELDAALTLGENGLQIKLDAPSSDRATLLRENRASLQAALAAAGIPPASISIVCHDKR